MRQRQTPRVIPPGSNYFSIEVPDHGPVHFRLPFPLWLAKITTLLQQAGIAEFAGGESADEALAKLDKALDIWILAGAAVGLCWFHRDFDLTTDRRDYGKDLQAYGEAVLEELHEEGISLQQLAAIYPPLFSRITQAIRPTGEEVAERAGFFARPRAGDSSSPSTSASTS